MVGAEDDRQAVGGHLDGTAEVCSDHISRVTERRSGGPVKRTPTRSAAGVTA